MKYALFFCQQPSLEKVLTSHYKVAIRILIWPDVGTGLLGFVEW
mgnify:CR=1 FL=1